MSGTSGSVVREHLRWAVACYLPSLAVISCGVPLSAWLDISFRPLQPGPGCDRQHPPPGLHGIRRRIRVVSES